MFYKKSWCFETTACLKNILLDDLSTNIALRSVRCRTHDELIHIKLTNSWWVCEFDSHSGRKPSYIPIVAYARKIFGCWSQRPWSVNYQSTWCLVRCLPYHLNKAPNYRVIVKDIIDQSIGYCFAWGHKFCSFVQVSS